METRAGDDSTLIQNDTQDRMTISTLGVKGQENQYTGHVDLYEEEAYVSS